ncbi:hypothetical protein ES706_02709 [subsurface metagenome]
MYITIRNNWYLKMRIYALVQGWYGQRIVLNLERRIPSDWTIEVYKFPRALPTLIEEPENFLPKQTHRCDLILSLGEHPAIASLLPDLVKLTGAEAVMVPIDNSNWVPPGVRTKVLWELASLGVASAFPKPFCSMEANSGNKFIDKFAERFGRPKLNITLKNELIESVDVLRSSPCGSTYFVAEKLLGVNKSEAPTRASLLVQIYPCLASRGRDLEYGEALIHAAAHILKGAVLKSIEADYDPR